MSGLTQAISTTPSYQNLTYSGAGLKRAAAGTLTIKGNWSVGSKRKSSTNNPTVNLSGDLTITAGHANREREPAFNIAANWSNAGTFTANAGKVTFNGGSPVDQ